MSYLNLSRIPTWKSPLFRRTPSIIGARYTSQTDRQDQLHQTVPQARPSQEEAPISVPFAKAKLGVFWQEPPVVTNQYTGDASLRSYLKRIVPADVLNAIEPDLSQFGERVATDVLEMSNECERNPPKLVQFNSWGERVDQLITCEAWKRMKGVSAEEGLIAIAYERQHGEWSRLYQALKLYLYSPSSGLYSCPLAMTDGAARTIEALSLKQLKSTYDHLTSRNPDKFWTSGQWMTERKGGSDVAGGCETYAVPQSDGTFRLYGYKWFSSATDADITFTLARTVGKDGRVISGTRGLSMFYAEVYKPSGALNNIQMVRLKDKLGTRQLPTAELLLDGTVAHLVSEVGRGVPAISNMLTLTRIHNSIASISVVRRVQSLARDYATKRIVFGRPIQDWPLHLQTLSRIEIEIRGMALMLLEICKLLGRDDCGKATPQDQLLLRVLVPVLKLYSAKRAMKHISELLEAFGGLGYLEDSGLPSMLRDTQVTPIWEGTTNVLSLDVLRAAAKSEGAVLEAFEESAIAKLDIARETSAKSQHHTEISLACDRVHSSIRDFSQFVQDNMDKLEVAARDLSFSIARLYGAALLLEHASWSGATDSDVATAVRWSQMDLTPIMRQNVFNNYTERATELDKLLVYEGYQK